MDTGSQLQFINSYMIDLNLLFCSFVIIIKFFLLFIFIFIELKTFYLSYEFFDY